MVPAGALRSARTLPHSDFMLNVNCLHPVLWYSLEEHGENFAILGILSLNGFYIAPTSTLMSARFPVDPQVDEEDDILMGFS